MKNTNEGQGSGGCRRSLVRRTKVHTRSSTALVAALFGVLAAVVAPKPAEACTDATKYYAGVPYEITGNYTPSYYEAAMYIGPNSPGPWPFMNGNAPRNIVYTFAAPIQVGVRLAIGATNVGEQYSIYVNGSKVILTAANLTAINGPQSGGACNIVGDGDVGLSSGSYCGTYIEVSGPVSTLEIRAVTNPGSGTVVDLDGAFITCGGCTGDYGSGASKACPVSTPVCTTPGINTGVCIAVPVHRCGDGTVDANEYCDDGNTTAGDGCSATCAIEDGRACTGAGDISCASGVCDTHGQAAPGLCEAAMTCGNGKLESGESCDDGGIAAGDGCSATCTLEDGAACGVGGSSSCASGVCDTLGQAAPGRCEAALTCGNGKLEAGESCDDGNVADGDACSSHCSISDGTACGPLGDASCTSGVCDALGQSAPGVCEAALTCGNGHVEAGEGCDDGNTAAGDSCDASCQVPTGTACGPLGAAGCASGVCDTVGQPAPGVCEAVLTCGNGVLEAGEGCDDGGTASGDGCTSTCKIETGAACGASGAPSCDTGICNQAAGGVGVCAPVLTCGNSVIEAGEFCDDGNAVAGDGCDAACHWEIGKACGPTGAESCASGVCDVKGQAAPGVCETALTCGNGKLEVGEGCDDGNLVAGDACDSHCAIELGAACGADAAGLVGDVSCATGLCNAKAGGAGVCAATLTCGNGKLEAGEGCDDGNTVDGDSCTSACLIASGSFCGADPAGVVGSESCASTVCNVAAGAPGICRPALIPGNGKLEAGEGCDDGNDVAGDGCDPSGKIEVGSHCGLDAAGLVGGPSCATGLCNEIIGGICVAAGVCGNGHLEPGEGCDDGGTASGDACSATCKVEVGQDCGHTEPGLSGSASCETGLCNTKIGVPGLCAARGVIGNGKLEAGEGCDDGNTVSGDGCSATGSVESGFPAGTDVVGKTGDASCASGVSQKGICVAADIIGNGKLETGEACDDGNKVDGDGCSAAGKLEIGIACTVGSAGDSACATGVCGVTSGRCEVKPPVVTGSLGGGCSCSQAGDVGSSSSGLLGLGVAAAALVMARRRRA